MEKFDADQVMMSHMIFEHPFELLSSPNFQGKLAVFFEFLGGNLADMLRNKVNG